MAVGRPSEWLSGGCLNACRALLQIAEIFSYRHRLLDGEVATSEEFSASSRQHLLQLRASAHLLGKRFHCIVGTLVGKQLLCQFSFFHVSVVFLRDESGIVVGLSDAESGSFEESQDAESGSCSFPCSDRVTLKFLKPREKIEICRSFKGSVHFVFPASFCVIECHSVTICLRTGGRRRLFPHRRASCGRCLSRAFQPPSRSVPCWCAPARSPVRRGPCRSSPNCFHQRCKPGSYLRGSPVDALHHLIDGLGEGAVPLAGVRVSCLP